MKKYRIHPGIGIARVGNSQAAGAEGYFVGPRVPDINFTPSPDGTYRDSGNNIRRQSQEFRIYEYSYNTPGSNLPTSVREITDDDAEIQWHVHLANNKAFTKDPSLGDRIPVPNDPGVKTASGANQSVDVVGAIFGDNVQLGTLLTDDKSRLQVVGAFGKSNSPSGAPIVGLYSADWYDDVADGPVRATVRMRDNGEFPAVDPAWIVTGVPGFASPIINVVTMYDLALDLAVRFLGHSLPLTVSFTRDIYPLLRRPVFMQWVSATARTGHGPGSRGSFLLPPLFDLLKDNNTTPGSPSRLARERVFQELRNPAGGGGGNMPPLFGLTITPTQYSKMREWSIGNFDSDWQGVPVQQPFGSLTPAEQAAALDKAGLWFGVGGSFGPGIEVGRRFGEAATFDSPFRINPNHGPGYLTETLSIPWQADYRACGTGWWPGARPNFVTADGVNFETWARFDPGDDMLNHWWKLGVLAGRQVGAQTEYLETERV